MKLCVLAGSGIHPIDLIFGKYTVHLWYSCSQPNIMKRKTSVSLLPSPHLVNKKLFPQVFGKQFNTTIPKHNLEIINFIHISLMRIDPSVFLSTFAGNGPQTLQVPQPSGSSGGGNIVRRNKKGKQAPAPPKRTSSFRDSQCDLDPDSQSYGLEDISPEVQFIRRRENASFEKLTDLTDADYADLSGADADDDSEISDTAQSVPDIRCSKDFRSRAVMKGKSSKSRTYPIKDHIGINRGSNNVGSGSSQLKTQVIINYFIPDHCTMLILSCYSYCCKY